MIPALVEAAVRAVLLALTVWAGLRLFRVSNVLAQKAAWGLVLACAVAMPIVMHWRVLPAYLTVRIPASLPARVQSQLDGTKPAVVVEPASNAALSSESAAVLPARFSGASEPASRAGYRFPAPAISSGEHTSTGSVRPADAQLQTNPALRKSVELEAGARLLRPGTVAQLLYLGISAVLLIRLGFGLVIAFKLWSAAEVFVPWPALHPETGLETRPGSDLRMRFSRAVSSPVTIGSGVLLPADCLEWDTEKLRIVLAHERAHVQQRDFYLQLLCGLYTAVFWFSPLGWLLKRELSDLGEAISDRAGLEEAGSRISYAQVLLEFAALPRPTVLGVAMARSRNLSDRMERFLNETRFRQAFAGGQARILPAIVVVSVALFAGTALVRVEAAATRQPVQTPPAAPSPAAAPAPAVAPVAPVGSESASGITVVPVGVPPAPPAPGLSPVPPAAPGFGEIHDAADDRVSASGDQDNTAIDTNPDTKGRRGSSWLGKGYSYSYSDDGESWVLVTDSSERVTFSGDWHNSTRDSIKKVRQLTNGKFLWFTHDGKDYFLDDAGIIGQIQAMYKPMEELGRQQEILGKQQEELGRQQEALGRKQEQASVPTPDISKEMARLNEAVAKLNAKKGSTVSQDDLADIEGKIGDIQGKLGELQGEMGARQGEIGAEQGKLGAEQGKLGAQQGRLGEEQGRIAAEADRKIKSMIRESLRNGTARPVE